MRRSLTVNLPAPARIARVGGIAVGVVTLAALGLWIGVRLFGPGPAVELGRGTELQEVQTVAGVYVGRIISDDGANVRLADPAQVRAKPGPTAGDETQYVVQRLATEPYGIGGEILIPREQIVLIGNVAPESELAKAYRQASSGNASPAP